MPGWPAGRRVDLQRLLVSAAGCVRAALGALDQAQVMADQAAIVAAPAVRA